ncbi:hypothetical protein M9458_048480 [Cirrhinus mrigala]|uniref:Uncharacterized protein n=1 Tax=Cirrhinus mrigala TaxID=683832 RepID=A0ABD0N520_CIRMR
MCLCYVYRPEDLESPEKSGNEDENGDMSGEEEEEGEEEPEVNGEKQDSSSKHHNSSSKHKKKKHKHRSKHKKHKHASEEDKDRKRKHRHKHKKHRRKEEPSSSPSGAINRRVEDGSPSLGNATLDDKALLEDLEKQRALIKAELDSQLMEGKVQSGMGLILQGYNSGSEEDGEGQRARNGEQRQRSSGGRTRSPRDHIGRAGRSRRDSTDTSKPSVKRRSRSREKVGRDVKLERMTKIAKETVKERSKSKEKKRSRSRDKSREHKALCREKMRSRNKSHRDQTHEVTGAGHEIVNLTLKMPGEKRPGKSPSKDTSSGKENRPQRRRSSSPRHRDRQSIQPPSGSADRSSKLSNSPSRHSHSNDRRRDSPSRYISSIFYVPKSP